MSSTRAVSTASCARRSTSSWSRAFARFVTGDLDISSDDDWNNYLAQLEALKLSRFVEILQIAYTRMYG